ncbi:pyroglutamyl-peptidase I [Georgenia sp. Z1344]|uniref:pyroglutamyl-peptidase I family protein n=1 Tax=Georgenia sp. Z1344 TaxID=3416706 RepID=UPI003CF9B50F
MTSGTVVVTGFGPFGTHAENPSADVVRALGADPGVDAGVRLVTEVLPTSFARATARVRELVAEHEPVVLLALGLAEDRTVLTVERVGVNLVDARIPDVDDDRPVDVPVRPGGPDAHLATIDVRSAIAAARGAGVEATTSASAGLFVCNAVLYTALDAAREAGADTVAGFVHLPPAGHLPVGDATRAVRAIVSALTPGAP